MSQQLIKCNRCGYENPISWRFCGNCGSQLPVTKQQNWFARHLNWTMFLTVLAGSIIALYFRVNYEIGLMSQEYILVSIYILCAIFVIFVEVWFLRMKGRSLWNLFYNLVPSPFNLIIILSLKNKRQ